MSADNRNDLGKILKQRRLMIPLTLKELTAKSGVSASHLGRIERGDRFPSANILQRIAKPLGFEEGELFTLAGYLSPQPSTSAEMTVSRRLDPYVAKVLAEEPVEIQRTVIGILGILKSIAKGSGCSISFAEFAHRNYPELDEDIITMIEDLLEHPSGKRRAKLDTP